MSPRSHASHFPPGRSGRRQHCSGFTLLEICLAVFIALLIVAAAVPSLSGLFDEKKGKATFETFNGLVQEARSRSIEERRPYVLLWTGEGVTMQADGADDDEEAMHLTLEKGDSITLDLPAALKKNPDSIWTFWPAGACEPATVTFKGKGGAWTATYNPFTAQAEVSHE